MQKCKKCKGTEFGVDVIEVSISPAKVIDGQVVEVYKEPLIRSEMKYKYCFTCNTDIENEDIGDYIPCVICGDESIGLIDGVCESCQIKSEELETLSKEELILKYLKENNR
ncbi:MAG: hypothetical protein ACRC30_11255 [Clostridium sp.]